MVRPVPPPCPKPPQGDDGALYDQLIYCEGERRTLYQDGGGNWTIGVGWNLSANGLPDWAIQGLYDQALMDATEALDVTAPFWQTLDPARQRAMINLSFNLNRRLALFPRFLDFVKRGLWDEAADELQGSLPWFTQVGRRGPLLVAQVRTGLDPNVTNG